MKISKVPPEPPEPPEPTFTLTLSLNEMRALVHCVGFSDYTSNQHFRRLKAALVAATGEAYDVSTRQYDRNACFRDV